MPGETLFPREAPMFYWMLRPFSVITAMLSHDDAPHQIGLGAALGMMAGLLPKDNLLAMLLATAIVCIRCNLGAAGLFALLFSWVGLITDPVACLAGSLILESPQLQPVLAWLYGLPLMPWTNFNNTAVAGNLLIGAIAAYPMYAGAFHAADQWARPVAELLAKYRIKHFVRVKNVISIMRLR